MDIILFGMQGSGKGTQGKILAKKHGLKVFEMGGALRSIIASGSPLGEKIKGIVEQGNLVDDDTVMEVVENFLSSLSESDKVLFDGIPRTLSQAKSLLSLLAKHGREGFALLIKISKEEAMKRLTLRRVCKQCKEVFPAFYESKECSECGGELITRHDDNEGAIRKRIENYEKETMPVIDSFYQVDRLIKVDGEQKIPDVTEEMIEKAEYLFT